MEHCSEITGDTMNHIEPYYAIDTETYGNPFHRSGKITCISIAFSATEAVSFQDPNNPQCRKLLESPVLKVFHNAPYDMNWLVNVYNIPVKGDIADTMVREALLDGSKKVSLDECSQRYAIGKKTQDMVQAWWEETGHHGKAIEHMNEVPFLLQKTYCEQDTKLTYQLYAAQEARIQHKGLGQVERLERDVLKPILRMYRNGIRFDSDRREQLDKDYKARMLDMRMDFLDYNLDPMSVASVREVFGMLGLESAVKTSTGADSFSKSALADIDHPLAQDIVKYRSMSTIYNTFIAGAFLDTFNGRLFTQFHQTGRDEGGTVTGRFSSSNPNLQNIPTKDVEIRSCFLPEEGQTLLAYDYKQIEYRVFANWAVQCEASGWETVRDAMIAGKDYHKFTLDLLGWEDDMRKVVKTVNFGVVYGMGKNTFYQNYHKMLKVPEGMKTLQYVDWIFNKYHSSLPFVKPTTRAIQKEGMDNLVVRSLAGRQYPFDDQKAYKYTNYKTQGSAADILKQALVNAEKAGVWDVLTLHITVHDEIVASKPNTPEGTEASQELVRCMKDMVCFPELVIPMDVDTEEGVDWGHCK